MEEIRGREEKEFTKADHIRQQAENAVANAMQSVQAEMLGPVLDNPSLLEKLGDPVTAFEKEF